MEELPRMSRSRRRSRSRRHSGHRSRSHSPRENTSGGNNSQDNNTKQTQFIPIPVPYYQPQAQPQPAPQQQPQAPTAQSNNPNNQPMSYVIPQPKQQYIEEFIQSSVRIVCFLNNLKNELFIQAKPPTMLTYGVGQQPLLVSNPVQPVYTIAYRANNGGNLLTSNILTGPAATTYVTASRNQIAEINSFNSDSDNEDKNYRSISTRRNLKKVCFSIE
jgi:hypothetical protein